MKIVHYFSIILLTITACNQPQNKTGKQTADIHPAPKHAEAIDTLPNTPKPADPIIAIREQVTAINTAKLQQKHTEFKCDELMKVDQLFNNRKLAKTSIDFGWIGDAHAIEDYYYDETGNIIFFYEVVEGGPACEGCIKRNEYRSYIHNGEVIKYLKNQTQEACRKCEFGSASKPARLYSARTPAEIKAILCP